jgi:DNA polymerase-1
MDKNMVINYPIQGTAFHCLLWSFIQINKISIAEGWRSRLIGQVHDSMVLDVHPDELNHVASTIQRVTCKDLPKAWSWIIVPLEVEADLCPVDASWADKQPYKLPEVN